MAEIRVGDVMTRAPRTVPATATVLEAYELMSSGGFRHLPVVDGARPIGILSDRDILQRMPSLASGRLDPTSHGLFVQRPVGELMTAQPLVVGEAEPLDSAVELMLDNQVSALLVAEDDTLRGIVTTVDIARTLQRFLRGELVAPAAR